VLVCNSCASTTPECACSFCVSHYFCPHCTTKPEVQAQCVLEEELEAARVKEVTLKERLEREKEQREVADKLAENVYEFWEGLLGDVALDIADELPELPGTEHNNLIDVSSTIMPATANATETEEVQLPPSHLTIPIFDPTDADDEIDTTFEVIDELIASGELVLM